MKCRYGMRCAHCEAQEGAPSIVRVKEKAKHTKPRKPDYGVILRFSCAVWLRLPHYAAWHSKAMFESKVRQNKVMQCIPSRKLSIPDGKS